MYKKTLDVVIPVYNESENIIKTLNSIYNHLTFKFNILICYDHDNDNTLTIIKNSQYKIYINTDIFFIKNNLIGAHGAVMSGINRSKSKFCVTLPADDNYNIIKFDEIIKIMTDDKIDILCPDRFIKEGYVKNGPFFKFLLARIVNYSLYYFARLPTKDATNGFRFFSKKVLDNIEIESNVGFTYSIEYLVKGLKKGYKISNFPALWIERSRGKSRFKIFKWASSYLKWYFIAIYNSFIK